MFRRFSILIILLVLSSLTFCQTNVSGTLAKSTVWTMAGSPYILTDSVKVLAGDTLTILPGVEVKGKFDIKIKGSIVAIGKTDSLITISGSRFIFNNTNISKSKLSYMNFVNSGSILLGNSKPLNSGYLILNNCLFSQNSTLKTQSASIPVSIIVNNSTFNSDSIYLINPLNSSITFNSCEFNHSVVSISTNEKGQYINNCNFYKSTLNNYGYADRIVSTRFTGCKFTSYNYYNSISRSILINSNLISNENFRADSCIFIYKSSNDINFNFKGAQIYKSAFICEDISTTSIGIKWVGFLSENYIKNCLIINNNIGVFACLPKINNCNFINNYTYNLKTSSDNTINAQFNYWGTTFDSKINAKLYDNENDINVGKIDYSNYLLTPDTSAPISYPLNVFKMNTDKGILIKWSANKETDLAGYRILYKPKGNYTFEKSIDVGTDTSFISKDISILDTIVIVAYDKQADGVNDLIEGHESWYSQPAQMIFQSKLLTVNSLCDNKPVRYLITTITNFSADNIFSIEMSDTLGNFNFPVILNSYKTDTSFYFNGLIPSNIKYGKQYKLRIKSSNPLSYGLSDPIEFIKTPSSDFIIDKSKSCNDDTVRISYKDKGSNSAIYNWNFNSAKIISGSGKGDYKINWSSAGKKTISLSVTENGCTSKTANQTIYAYKPNSAFTVPSTACEKSNVNISLSGNASDSAAYSWNFDSAKVISGSGKGPYSITWDKGGQKNLSLIINDNGCISGLTQKSVIYKTPSSEFHSDKSKSCNNDTVRISYTGNGSANATYNWNFNNAKIISGSGKGDYKINWSSAGKKTISLSVTENGCTSTTTTSKTIYAYKPVSVFNVPAVACEKSNASISFTGNASDSAAYTWNFDSATVISGSGKGPYLINWNNYGDKAISLLINDNGCKTESAKKIIGYNPNPISTFSAPSVICYNDAADINYSGNYSATATYSWNFSNGSIQSGSGKGPYKITWNSPGSKIVSLYVTDKGCNANSYKYITVNNQTLPVSLCLVSSDSLNHNIIYWEQQTIKPTDSVFIYKESTKSNIYSRIGSISGKNKSIFTDTTSNAQINSSRYVIAIKDTCDYITPMSIPHKTIHLSISPGTNGAWNLNWDNYEGISISTFNIYRGNSENSLQKIVELPGNIFTYTDLNPPTGNLYYMIEIEKADSCIIKSVNSTDLIISSSRSNIVTTGVKNGISNQSEKYFNVNISPNPVTDKLKISYPGNTACLISVMSILGEEIDKINVYSGQQIDLSNYNSGVYILKLCIGNKTYKAKIIKE